MCGRAEGDMLIVVTCLSFYASLTRVSRKMAGRKGEEGDTFRVGRKGQAHCHHLPQFLRIIGKTGVQGK